MKLILFLSISIFTFSVWAQDQPASSSSNSLPVICRDNAAGPQTEGAHLECQAYKNLIKSKHASGVTTKDSTRSRDGAITCKVEGPHTLDYKACTRALTTYEALLVTEMLLIQSQRIDTQNRLAQIARETQARQQAGADTTVNSLEAVKQTELDRAQKFKQQAMVFQTQATTLASMIAAWPTEKNACKGAGNECQSGLTALASTRSGEIFANKNARTMFGMKATEIMSKGINAYIQAKGAERNANQVSGSQNQLGALNDPDVEFNLCQTNPQHPSCTNSGSLTFKPGEFNTSDISFGAGGSQVFGNGQDPAPFGDMGNEGVANNPVIPGAGDPFSDEVKKANDLLDVPGASQYTGAGGGGVGGGAGGGMAGGGGGGGGGQLGGDLETADAQEPEGESEIKVTKSKVAFGGGGEGFAATGAKKEEKGLFHSLFDDKKAPEGGIELDRSIASEIAAETSDLFKRISSRYVKAYESKKIESLDLTGLK